MSRHEYEKMSIRTFLKEYDKKTFGPRPGKRPSPDPADDIVEMRKTMLEAGWKDWSCHTSELGERLESIVDILRRINDDFLLDGFHVNFRNLSVCRANGRETYDVATLIPFDDGEIPQSLRIEMGNDESQWTYRICTERNGWNPEALFSHKSTLVTWLHMWSWRLTDESFSRKE